MVNSPGFLQPVTSRGAKRVALIPNGADPAMFDPSDSGTIFRRSNKLEDKFIVLYAGAHGMSNDLNVILDAAGMLASIKNIHIVFLGDGKEKKALMAQAIKIQLSNVTFLPPVPKSGMVSALAGADACIAILKPLEEYKTTYPNKVFDYMAAGRPVVLAIDGVIREVVEAAGCGIFAAPGNAEEIAKAIRKLAEDAGASRDMGLRGRRYLEGNFSRAVIGEKLVRLLEEIVSDPEGS